MVANEYQVELREHPGIASHKRSSVKLHVDAGDDDRLRELLIEQVTAYLGDRRARTVDLSKWSIRLVNQYGRVVVRFAVDAAGRSVVKR